jgi:ABC-type amino acid transport substrate-binding protein
MFLIRHLGTPTSFNVLIKSRWFYLLFFTFSTNIQAIQNKFELKVFAHTKNHPFVYKDEQAKWQGIEIDIIAELVKRSGFTYTMIENLDWNNAFTALHRGEIDMMPTLSYTLERKKSVHFLGISGYEKIVLITLQDSQVDIKELDDFIKSKHSFGLVNNVLYSDDFNRKLIDDPKFKDKFYFTNALDTRVKLVKNKRIVGFLYRKHSAIDNFKNNSDFKGLKFVELPVFQPEPIYLGIRKTLPLDVIEKLRESYKQLIEEGVISQLYSERLNDDFK